MWWALDFDGGDELIQRHANIVIAAISRHGPLRFTIRASNTVTLMVDQISPHTGVAKYHLVSKGTDASVNVNDFAGVHYIGRIEGLFDSRHEIHFHL